MNSNQINFDEIREKFSESNLCIFLDEIMLEECIKRQSMAFEEQFHVGCFYAYIKLKEQEIKNVCLLADLIT